MTIGEFALIHRYFERQSLTRPDVALAIGDDCALLRVPPGQALAVTVDMLVAGIHFSADVDPMSLGHKSLAVNLSDLAAMGAEPAWVTLAIALAEVNELWLQEFCRGFFSLADRFQVQLVGGDTTQGPLTISVQAHGFVPEGQALRRDGARPGDIVCVTGTLGDARLALDGGLGGLKLSAEQRGYLRSRLERPNPRIEQGLQLRGLASAVIDVSDGLAQDLGHVLERSGVGARLHIDHLPLSSVLRVCCRDTDQAVALALSGGDDYELCFTVPPPHMSTIRKLARAWDCCCTAIGVIEVESGLRCERKDGSPFRLERLGYEHFT